MIIHEAFLLSRIADAHDAQLSWSAQAADSHLRVGASLPYVDAWQCGSVTPRRD